MNDAGEKNDKGPDKEETISTASFGGSVIGPGGQVGPYKLLSILGEGGYGLVYLAEQQRPIKRKVALKIIKPGMDTKEVIARFEAERQALAMLEHPNIAHVFSAGTTEAGRPYFVMEYVKGVPITEHCDRHKLTIEELLNLFLRVCEAVQHAHQKGIIHRDIKPSNIQVSIEGEKAVPKVIDFGVAKAISQSLTERTLVTEQGQFIGTPEYMSPEQAEMTGQDVDTRTDIYSLGVVLYRLLTGVLPFDTKTLREGGIDRMRKIICEEEPGTPSTKLSTLGGEESTRLAQRRRIDPGALHRRLRGDLDWITLKAMEKDRTRRYQTAHALSEDIQRHLNNEPVLAGPPSKIYRLKKLLRKYRTQAIAAAMAAVLLACIAVIFMMYVQAVSRGKEAEFIKHKGILSKAMEFRSRGQFQDAMSKVETMVNSEHVGPEAHLLRARLILELQGPAAAVKELQKLLNERDEIACQAHFLLARIFLESDPGDPETTGEYQEKAKEHQQKGEKLFSESAEAYFNRSMMAGTVNKTLDWLNKGIDLEPGHYDSLEARALAYYAIRKYDRMEIDAYVMIGKESNNSKGYALRAIARRQKAIEETEKELFGEALRDHDKAIKLSPAEAELYDQRRRTHMQIGNYEQVLSDARECIRLQPDEKMYRFHVFCALVASGYYDEAKVEYDTIIKSGLILKSELDIRAGKYVSDTLDAGLSWHPPERRPEGAAFLAMHESGEIYHELATKARRVVPEGFRPTWSPDGTEFAYSGGSLGFSGIEILNLKSGKTRLLTVPGLDPAWSPDGHYIAFARVRQPLLLADFIAEHEAEMLPLEQREIWIIKSDGTEDPRFVARGLSPSWSSDPKQVFYHSPKDMKLYSVSIEDGAEPTPIVSCPGYYPVVSPDEKYVAYTCSGELRIVELATKSVVARWTVPIVLRWQQEAPMVGWSPNGQELSVGSYINSAGLWIYDLKKKKASKVLSGQFEWCSWSPADDKRQMAIGRQYGILHHEIWVANLDPNVSAAQALGPGRTLEEHYQEMIDFYTRRINVEPEEAGHYLTRAECYIYLDDREKAFADLEKSAGDPSRNANTYNDLAWILVTRPDVKLRKPTFAVELAKKAIQAVPEENSSFWNTLGVAHYRAGQWEEAITALTKSTKLPGGENSTNFLFLSMAHWQSGDKAAAANWYNKVPEWIRKRKLDVDTYLEAVELMGIKVKEFDRKAPLTGKQIVPVTGRADSSHLDMTVAHILDGTSLVDGDGDGLLEHGETAENMWLSEQGRTKGWIEFDLGGVYELGSIFIWNYNERDHTKRGIKRADISVWTQDTGWEKIFDDFEFAEAEGSFDYDEPTMVRFDGAKAQKVRFDDLISLGDEEYVGLSEVQFFESWGNAAIRPYPADGEDIGLPSEAKLSWTPGGGVKAHKVYFGRSPDNLRHLDQVQEPNCVDMPELQERRRYFWRVDVVKSDGIEVKGDLWTFSTGRMVGWWKFDEIGGETVTDSSGNDFHGKLVGDAHIISDPERSNVLSLDGDGDYVNCGNNPAFGITSSITVAAWIKVNVFERDWQAIVTKGDSAWRFSRKASTDFLAFHCTGIKSSSKEPFSHLGVEGTVNVNDGKWYHVMGVYDGKGICLYVDGVVDNSEDASGKIDINNQPVYIGGNSQFMGREWNGLIDEVRIYSYALSKAEIKALYAGKEPPRKKELED